MDKPFCGTNTTAGDLNPRRCAWVTDEVLARYHDLEWGQQPDSDAGWLELIVLETFQAGLSWRTILHKRAAFCEAFADFAIDQVAAYDAAEIERLMTNPGIVRNRKKVAATVANARIAQELVCTHGSLAEFLVGLPRETLTSTLQRTFRFVGPTTAESIAIAAGLLPVPHEPTCFLATATRD